MDERGWGWTISEIRQIQLVEWIVPQSASTYVPVKPFYDELADQDVLTLAVVDGDLRSLQQRSLLDLAAGLGGIESYDALATPEARRLVEDLQARRANKRLRKAACRDAMVDWLYSQDGLSPLAQPARDEMLNDLHWGVWFAQPFSVADLDAAAAWLYRHGLVKGIMVDECEGPIRLYLTDSGVTSVEGFRSDTGRYVETQQRGPGSGPAVQIGTNSGQVQIAGDRAHQVQNIGTDAEQLRLLITGIAEIVRSLVPDASDAHEAERAALAAVSERGVDRTALQRFRDWVLSTLRAGSTSAAVAAVSSATTTLLIEAGHLASHLG
jgi:hypothetical protein